MQLPEHGQSPTFWQALKQLPQGFLDLFATWAEDIKLRRERDWTAEYAEAFEAGHEAARREAGASYRLGPDSTHVHMTWPPTGSAQYRGGPDD